MPNSNDISQLPTSRQAGGTKAYEPDGYGTKRALQSGTWVVPELPELPEASELMSLRGMPLSFAYQDEYFLARFSTEGTLFGGLEDEAAIFLAIGEHANIQEFIGIREINGVCALVFRNNDCVPLDRALHNVASRVGSSARASFGPVFRLLAQGMILGVDAVHRAGYVCGGLTLSDLSVCIPTMEIKTALPECRPRTWKQDRSITDRRARVVYH
jgi:hypothetical protein